ncbi:MAG: hypothetical protein KQI62_19920 [Deltaproteobacteria bacterium]|nr:hypothetical protein [Deltaproteobacteria bacterium]
MAGKEEQELRLFKWGALILGFVALVLISEAVIVYLVLGDWGKSGTFGDTFGAANALFSGLAFGGVIIAILLQRKELELQRKELELTRNELARTAAAQENSEKIFKQQLYYSFLASKTEALNTAINFYSNKMKEYGHLSPYREKMKDAERKRNKCETEIEKILGTFRKSYLEE